MAPQARAIGATIVAKSLRDALEADTIILAIPFWEHREVVKALPSWEGKTVIDAMNAFGVLLALVGALILAGRIPARIDNRLIVASGMALVVYGNWRMLGYSPLMDWWPVLIAGMLQGAGLGILLPALTKTAFSTLEPAFRPEGTVLFNLSRLYGSTIGIAVVLIFFYDNTQAMHVALAKDLAPYRAAAHVASSIAKPALATLNDMLTGQAAFIGVIDQFKVMMIAMPIVSPLVLLLKKPNRAQ